MYLEPLPPIEVPFTSENPAKNDDILPLFFIPSFEDRPQDPIIERLKAETSNLPQHKPQDRRVESPVLDILSAAQDQDFDLCSQSTKTGTSSDIWEECLKEDIQRSFAISWDGFGSPAAAAATSAFFAEQPLRTFISAQNSVPNAGNARLVYRVKPHQLLSAVQMLLVGYSSPLFIFDPGKETFSINMKHNQDFDLIVDGYSVSSTQSMLHRFCDIGTLIRRLDNYILSVRSQASSQTLHSLAHAIQQTNTYIKSEIEKSLQKQTGRVLELWEDQQRHERLLTPLAAVCGRDLSQSPPYHLLPDSETEILSLVYSHLLHHATSTSPREVQAIFAFILSKTSKHWQQLLNESLGLTPLSGGRSVKSPNDVTEANPPTTSPRLKFPNFIHKSASQQIFRGKRSLEILQKAKPDHPLCAPLDPRIAGLTHGWVWTEEEVERVIHKMEQYVNRMKRRVITWRRSGGKRKDRPDTPSPIKAKPIGQSSSSQEPMLEEDIAADEAKYKPELLGFTKFDLEPGTHFRMHSQAEKVEIHLPVASEVEPDLRKALATFPDHLPISTPTLGHLTQITVIEPLLAHSRLLSTSLLDLFLIDLHLLAHLDYVRRFALMGDQRFVANLRTALFDEWNNTPSSEISTHVGEWGVGLSTTLSETGEWPPSQTRISFLLRQVIVDALDAGEQVPPGKYDEVMEEELDVLRKEAEWRIGFFIKNQDEEEEPPWMDSMGE
ncbi:hypothetical protein FRC02_003024 [Tulasnella sp. 418]|nr:hypothetical protein FRC02_003024 [Tulasnella sp. 418]